MRKLVHVLLAALLTAAFVTGAYAQEKPNEATKGKPTVKVIMTIVGMVRAVDAAGKTITMRPRYETEYYVRKDTVLTREYVADKKPVTIDISKATFGGCGGDKCASIEEIKKGDHIRVAYDKVGGVYVAHTILKIGKRGN